MKKIIKNVIQAFLALSVLLCLGGCSDKGISDDAAKAHIVQFFEAVEAGDYEAAEALLHPERPADLESFFVSVGDDKGIDFSSIEIKKYTGASSSWYDSTVGGSAYSLKMELNINGKEAEAEIEIVENDNGYGIYNFELNAE